MARKDRSSCFMSKKWRLPWAVWAFFITEFAFTIPALALFAIAQPDLYRTNLRQFGSDHGWNSDPSVDVYDAANYLPLKTPPPWSEFTTDYNVIISILSMFVLLVKVLGFVLHMFWPLFGFITHAPLVGMWAYSIYAQVAPDTIDPDPSKHNPGAPWYITRGCSMVESRLLHGYCQQAQASLAVTVIMLTLFALNTLLAVWSMFPTKAQKEKRARKLAEGRENDLDLEDNNFKYPPPPQSKGAKVWEHEMKAMPVGQPAESVFRNPVTPRTQAFNRLAGDLPLRQS